MAVQIGDAGSLGADAGAGSAGSRCGRGVAVRGRPRVLTGPGHGREDTVPQVGGRLGRCAHRQAGNGAVEGIGPGTELRV
ncbi:hypothetical protein ACFFX0_15020 [Citricoccus parietis]|uniref:Uncharacterized protein n=1 Tax=Citricoccus parietis TaxID=592307 RepID=A0ABV5G0H7_9MICC